MSNREHAATQAVITAMRHARTLEESIAAEEFTDIGRYVNVVVKVIAAYEQPSDFRDRSYAYIVLDDGAGPRVTITGDTSVPQILRYMREGRLPALLWLKRWENENNGLYKLYWNKARKGEVPGHVKRTARQA